MLILWSKHSDLFLYNLLAFRRSQYFFSLSQISLQTQIMQILCVNWTYIKLEIRWNTRDRKMTTQLADDVQRCMYAIRNSRTKSLANAEIEFDKVIWNDWSSPTKVSSAKTTVEYVNGARIRSYFKVANARLWTQAICLLSSLTGESKKKKK